MENTSDKRGYKLQKGCIEANDGIKLETRILTPIRGSLGQIVYHTPHKGSFSMYLREARELALEGWEVILYNHRGIRKSGGDNFNPSVVDDHIGLLQMLKEKNPDAQLVGIGLCYGSYIQAVANSSDSQGLYDLLITQNMPVEFHLKEEQEKIRTMRDESSLDKAACDKRINDLLREIYVQGMQQFAKDYPVKHEDDHDWYFDLHISPDKYLEMMEGFIDSKAVDELSATQTSFVHLVGLNDTLFFKDYKNTQSYLQKLPNGEIHEFDDDRYLKKSQAKRSEIIHRALSGLAKGRSI